MPKQMESARLALAGAAMSAVLLAAPPAFAGNMCAANPTGACPCACDASGAAQRRSWAAAAAQCPPVFLL